MTPRFRTMACIFIGVGLTGNALAQRATQGDNVNWAPTGTAPGPYATSTLSSAAIGDSVPYVIVTTDSLRAAFQGLADWKTRKGSKAEIKTVSQIEAQFPTEPDQAAKIRKFIQWSYVNRKTEWVLLGGDVSLVPSRWASMTLNPTDPERALTDYYFACLDGSWNADADTFYGEFLDSVDLYPEIYVGRLPVTSSAQVANIVNKLMSYERRSPYTNYQTRALVLASEVFWTDDGLMYADSVAAHLPANFQKTRLYQYPSQTGVDSLNTGFGIVFNYSHASNFNNFITVWPTIPRDVIDNPKIDGLTNTDRYSVFLNATCHYNHLEQDALSKHFMLNPTGAGVAYISTFNWEGATVTQRMHLRFLDEIFINGKVNIGKALFNSKQTLVPWAQIRDNTARYMVYSYNLLGDPQMEVWTATPKRSSQKHLDAVYAGTTYTITDTVREAGTATAQPIQGAVVCLKKGTEAYQVKTTDANGVVSFSANFPTVGTATLIASKAGYFPDSSAILVTTELPPCIAVRKFAYENDGQINLSDLVRLINCAFSGSGDCDRMFSTDDVVILINLLFTGPNGPPIPARVPDPGTC